MAKSSVDGAALGAFGLAILLTLLGLAIGDSTVGLILTPVVFFILIFVMARVPLRTSLMALMFCALVLENPDDAPAEGKFKTPFYTVGAILLTHINTVDRSLGAISGIFLSGMDFCLIALGLIALSRKMSKSRLDSAGQISTPRPLVRLAYVSLAGTMFVWFVGLARGGDFGMSLWQLNRVVYLPVIFLLFHLGLRGPNDHRALARLVIAAATIRALQAVYVMHVVSLPWNPMTGSNRPAYATSHHDSMLFALAILMLVVLVAEGASRSAWKWAALLLPVIAYGIVANNRRLAWVQVALVLLVTYIVTPDGPFKRRARRAAYAATPLIVLYTIIGWGSSKTIFKPVRSLRSVVDAQSDSSSFWREMENYNLISTLQMNPVLGTGYGHPYVEVIPLPQVDYSLERYAPHNSILGLWAYCGVIGYTTLTLLWVAGVYFAMRSYRAATVPAHRVAAITAVAMVLIYLVQCWGDVGVGSWGGVFMVAAAIAASGKLAVAVGAWGGPKKPQPEPQVWSVHRAA